jgi:hypothetical protein
MYRQIRIHEDDQHFQRILWRNLPSEKVREYQLTTVTFGTNSAPYLAIRTLQQIAFDNQFKFPLASEIILNDFYVDDLISGNETLEEALICQQQLINSLSSCGFKLRKWSSNNGNILTNIPAELQELKSYEIKLDETVKTLGISWNPTTDTFEFKVYVPNAETTTKRKLLSEASKLFDPLGWLSPTIIQAKVLLQQLWLSGINWDEKLPENIAIKWRKYKQALPELEQVKIPRWINNLRCNTSELHGFCDASEVAYAAAVYFISQDENGIRTVTLLTAKTKVAPIKSKISLPRLELCGALLLAKLLRNVQEAMQFHIIQTYAWCDSKIVLAWIKGSPMRWKTFVANRVSEIQEFTQPLQ